MEEANLNEKNRQTLEEASTSNSSNETKSKEGSPGPHFDFLNWLYWNLWWQQYSYWNTLHQHSFVYNQHGNQIPNFGIGQSPTSGSNVTGGGQGPPQWNANIGMSQFQPGRPIPQPAQGIANRIVSGYESCMAPLWRRGVAEVIDTVLFGILLKFYLPDIDYRVPELIFEGPGMWKRMATEELVDAKHTLLQFLYSTLLQRLAHIVLEALWLSAFACTPGKWLLGLRVWKCSSPPQLTRTTPGFSVKLEPGGNMAFFFALGRSLFKSTVSLVVPLVIFFFQLDKGRTQYDKLFRCIVVDTYSLNKPLYTTVYTRTPVIR